MIIVRPTSLATIIDSTADLLFFQKHMPGDLLNDIAMLLMCRQAIISQAFSRS